MRPLSSSPSRVASYNRGILIYAIRLVKLTICALLGCLSSPVISGAQANPVKRVLIFYELGLSSPTVGLVDQELHEALAGTPYEIELYHEYFETILFPDPLAQQEFRDWYIHKYRNRRPDLIIALGPAPLKFLVDSHEKFFTDIPIVFGGAAEVEAGNPILDGHFTGLWERYEPEKTLEAALYLQPNTHNVVVVGGISPFDRRLESLYKIRLHSYEQKLNFTYLTDLDMPTLLEQLKHLPPHTVVLYTHLGLDADGTEYIGPSQAGPVIIAAANAPVFSLCDSDLGHGEVGGYLESLPAEGRIVGEIASRILKGEKVQDIPIGTAADAFTFDWRAMQRWGLKERNLPAGSIVLNRQSTFWEAYRQLVVAGVLLLLVQTAIIVALLWQWAKRRKTQEALRKSEEKFSIAFREGPLALTLTSVHDDRYIEVNETFENYTGWRRDEVIDRTPSDLSLWVDPGERSRFVERLLDDGYVRNLEVNYRTKGGEVRTGLGSAELIEVNGERCALSVIADITDSKRAEARVRESQERLEGIVASAMDAIIAVNSDQHIVVFNAAAEAMFGCAAQEALHSSIDRFIPQRFHFALEQHIRHAGQHGINDLAMGPLDALFGLRTNGEEFPIEASISQASAGEGLLFTVIIRDATLRNKAEAAVRESEQRFRLVANTAPVMIWMSGTDMLCNYCNRPWLEFTGRSLEAELGNGWADGIHPDDRERCWNTYTAAFERRLSFEMEYLLRRHDGEYRWIADFGVPRFNPDGSFAGYIGSCLDVTQHKLAAQALSSVSCRLIEAHEEERTWLARELHDDINQRLAFLTVTLDIVKRGLLADVAGASRSISEVREQIIDLGNDIQALSHRLHSSKLDYLGLAAAASAFCKEFSERQGVRVDFNGEAVPKNLSKEISLCLFRVLQESLQNAKKHSGSPHLQVSFTYNSDKIELTVRDSGTGFNVEQAMMGHGLGIASMRERLKLVDGVLSIDSQAQKGTAIHATVPLILVRELADARRA